MALDCPILDLAPHWAGDDDRRDIIVVRHMDGLRLIKGGGYRKVAAGMTIAQLGRMSRTLERQMSDFLARTTIDMPGGRAPSHQQTLREIVDYIKHDLYVGLRRARAERWGDDPSVEERRLVRDIERRMRGHIHEGGRRYKLVAGADMSGMPDRNSYEVVRHDDGVRVLEALSRQHATQAELAQNLNRASANLSPDWRPPRKPTGIVLLRKLVAHAVASVKPTPVITPSQMRAMMAEEAAVITYLEVPEFIASGSETVALCYGFHDPHRRLTDVVLEIFTDDDRTIPIWSHNVPADHVTAGEGSLDWNGKVDSKDEEFPDGFATLASSPYVVRLSARQGSRCQTREAKIRVEVAEVKLAVAPVACLTDTKDQEVVKGIRSLADSQTVRLRAKSFILWNALNVDLGQDVDVGHQLAVAPWGNGAGVRIPLIATVLVWSSGKQPQLAGKALGSARVLWDYVDGAPGPVPDEGPANSSYLRAVEQYDQANAGPPNGRNAPEVLGGKRSRKTSSYPVFASPDSSVKDFPFASEAGKTRFWSAFAEVHRDGEHEAQAGVVFRPSAIAGDVYWIKAYVDVDGTLDSPEPIDAKIARAETSQFQVEREVVLVRCVRKNAEVTIELRDINRYTLPAFLHFEDHCPNKQEILGKAEYLAALQAALAADPSSGNPEFDRHALLPMADQYDVEAGFWIKLFGGPEREPRTAMLRFRTFDEFIDACEDDRSLDPLRVAKLKRDGEDAYVNLVGRRARALAGPIGSAFAAPGGVTVAAFSDVHNLGRFGLLGGMAAAHPTDRSKITILLFREDAGTLAHELGHCLFLPHAPTSPGLEIDGVKNDRHILGNDQCLMSYGPTRPGFCAICLLRLRGANGDHLKPNGIVP
jgi:hypothetical protein